MIIPKEYYSKDPEQVAIKFLGKLLVRELDGKRMSGYIVETEAYYGAWDPASKAYKSQKGDLAKTLYGEVGLTLIYGIHGKWLLNIVAHKGDGGAVLIRAIEPHEGLEYMIRNSETINPSKITNGPGKLCKALSIDKKLHKKPVYTRESGLWIEEGREVKELEIARSHRIGVKIDLEKPLRFYIKGNPYVSKRKQGNKQ
ncbi:MAG: DNA-3-methyladenine glycosylase [archaeon GBS-70-058]|nr:DNA-3-methyladenine glycosylase [Candidatus Culexarchaeum nevadense]